MTACDADEGERWAAAAASAAARVAWPETASQKSWSCVPLRCALRAAMALSHACIASSARPSCASAAPVNCSAR